VASSASRDRAHPGQADDLSWRREGFRRIDRRAGLYARYRDGSFDVLRDEPDRHRASRATSGVLVALVGPDGCGKTTTSKLVEKRVRASSILSVRRAYLGPWGEFELPTTGLLYRWGLVPAVIPWSALLRRRVRAALRGRSEAEAPASPEHSLAGIALKALKAQVRGGIYYPLLFAELYYRYLKSVRPALQAGHIVIAERYVFDLRYIHDAVEIENYPLMRKWVCTLFPQPDLTFLLDNEPERIHQRKPQLSVEDITWQRESYRRVLADRPHRVVRTDLGPEGVAGLIIDGILEVLERKNGR